MNEPVLKGQSYFYFFPFLFLSFHRISAYLNSVFLLYCMRLSSYDFSLIKSLFLSRAYLIFTLIILISDNYTETLSRLSILYPCKPNAEIVHFSTTIRCTLASVHSVCCNPTYLVFKNPA